MKVKPVWNNAVSVVLFVLVVTVRSAVLRDDPPSSGEAREGRKLLYGTYAGFYYDDYDGLYSDEDGTDVSSLAGRAISCVEAGRIFKRVKLGYLVNVVKRRFSRLVATYLRHFTPLHTHPNNIP
jgi:hypothetical protein